MSSQQQATELAKVDVTGALPFDGEPNVLVGSVHRPVGAPRAVFVCWPGGSYGRSYWEFANWPGYDFATYMTARGFMVIAADPLGVGDSSHPAAVDTVTLEVMASACADFTSQLRDQLAVAAGTPFVGLGHSLGGCITVIAQALHESYDRVVSLGYTHGAKDAVTVDGDDDVDAWTAATTQAQAFFTDWEAGYAISPRGPNHGWLYMPSTPAAVIAADDRTVKAWPRQAYVEALVAGYTAPFACRLRCPVFLGFGDHDIPDRPRDEAAFYGASSDLTVVVMPDAAHCHNFATSRHGLWDRIAAWAAGPTIST